MNHHFSTSVFDWLDADAATRAEWRRQVSAYAATVTTTHGVFISVTESEPEQEHGGELAGIPFAVKDNIDVADLATTAGSPLLAHGTARIDAGVVSVLKASGAMPIGKTNMHELAYGITSNNAHFGAVRNPLDPSRTAGGSSGGSAAAVAIGCVPFSLGTDTGASVTVPASFCGVVGFRPSTRRYPGDGIVNVSWTRDTVGIHARTVAETQTIDHMITRVPVLPVLNDLTGVRIGVVTERFSDLDPEVAQIASRSLQALKEAGAELIDVVIDNEALLSEAGMTIAFYETAVLLPERASKNIAHPNGIDMAEITEHVASSDVKAIMDGIGTSAVTDEQYEEARGKLWELKKAYEHGFTQFGLDALICPTTVALPPKLGNDVELSHNGRDLPLFATLTRNTASGTSIGAPMISLPAGTTDAGLSVGMLLEGRFFEDDRLLQIAEAVERSFIKIM